MENQLISTKSTSRAEIVPINLRPHPNADTLSICDIFSAYTCVCKTQDWVNKTRGIYIVPDTLVPVHSPEFAFLINEAKYDENSEKGNLYARIKAKRLRGQISYGLLIPAPENSRVGEDYFEILGLKHYEPPIKTGPQSGISGGEAGSPPPGVYPKYDVDSFMRYAKNVFINDESVIVSEKLHGASYRVVYLDGQLYVGSRIEWKKEFASQPKLPDKEELIKKLGEEKALQTLEIIQKKIDNWKPARSMWWEALKQNSDVEKFVVDNPGICVYAEVYGQVQDLKYGTKPGEFKIGVFDLLKNGNWINYYEARDLGKSLPWVPVVEETKFNIDYLISLAEGYSLIKGAENQIREGVVVKTPVERYNHVGRAQLKIINPAYLER